MICKPRPKKFNHNRRNEEDSQSEDKNRTDHDQCHEDQGPLQRGAQGMALKRGGGITTFRPYNSFEPPKKDESALNS